MEQYIVKGMSCAACQARVEKAVAQVPGVDSVSVSLLTNSMGVEGTADSSDIISAVVAAGYKAKLMRSRTGVRTDDPREDALKDTETPLLRRRLILSAVFLAILMYITMGHHMLNWPLPGFLMHKHIALAVIQMILALTVMAINHKFFTSGFSSLIRLSPNMDTLVALGSSVSFGWSLFVLIRIIRMTVTGVDDMSIMEIYHNELYFESAAMIPALITVGKMLEAMTKGRTTDALRALMKLRPETAVIMKNGVETRVPIDEVAVGDLFVVRPGESVPVDGIIEEGTSAIDESALTGESIPVDKAAGDRVSAATINRSGYITCRAVRVGEDTTLSQIINMVSDAAATKAPVARIADRVSGVFVPSVIILSAIVIAGWLIAGQTVSFALARGISVLVISCPCALGLATPVAIMVGNGIGARHGILFKTGEALENAGRIRILALDKTGTVTTGEPELTDICPASGHDRGELMKVAYSMEKLSEHPLAKAIVKAGKKDGTEPYQVRDFEALPGSGLSAVVDGRLCHAGNAELISGYTDIREMDDIARRLSKQGRTPLYFERDGELAGIIAVADRLKSDSADGIERLKGMGIRVIMLTGDNETTAAAIASEAGVDEVRAGILPDGKESVIRELKELGRTAMVGDGINDAPALTRADVGIAIGAGTDVAIDSADIVLMNSSVSDVAGAIRISRMTLINIYENLFWAFFYNLICIPLAAGLFPWKMNPMIGAAAMSLSSFTVCLNALRLNLKKINK